MGVVAIQHHDHVIGIRPFEDPVDARADAGTQPQVGVVTEDLQR